MQHIGRVSFVPPQHRGHATNNLRDHFSCYVTLNILYLKKKKFHTTWHKAIYLIEGQMLFNKRHSTFPLLCIQLSESLPVCSHLAARWGDGPRTSSVLGQNSLRALFLSPIEQKEKGNCGLEWCFQLNSAYLGILSIFSINCVLKSRWCWCCGRMGCSPSSYRILESLRLGNTSKITKSSNQRSKGVSSGLALVPLWRV